MNAYATVETLRSPAVLDIRSAEYDLRLRSLLESVSRQVDGYCNRHFYVLSATRLFDGDGSGELRLPDLVSVDRGGLSTDDDLNGAFETVWEKGDYLLRPTNADPSGGHDSSAPYTSVAVSTSAGSRSRFPPGTGTVKISGRWGYWQRLRAAGELKGALDSTQTQVELNDSHSVETGHTLLVNGEQVYVGGIDEKTAVVERGVNGTRPSAHASGDAVWVYEYPGPVSEAAMLQVARLWRRRDSSFASAGRFPGDSRTTLTGLDPDVRQLIGPYRRLVAGVV